MIKLIYKIKPEEYSEELEWLKAQKIYPSTRNTYAFENGEVKPCMHIGVIVSEEAALSVKLRHQLLIQAPYKK